MALDKNSVLTDGEIAEINNNSLKDPFSYLGMHGGDKGVSVRTIQYGATKVEVINRSNGKSIGEMNRVGDSAIFTARHF